MKKELLVLLASVLTFYTGKTVSAKETYQLLGVNPAGEYYVEQESLEKALQKEKGGLLEQVKTKSRFEGSELYPSFRGNLREKTRR